MFIAKHRKYLFSAVVLLSSICASSARAGDETTETTSPIVMFMDKVHLVPYTDWDSACAAAKPPGCYTTGYQTNCYSGARGGYKDGGPGCYYAVTATNTTFVPPLIVNDPDWFGGGWAGPVGGCLAGWTLDGTNGKCTRTRTRYMDCGDCYGNPIYTGMGQKVQTEIDLGASGASRLSITRQYSSLNIERKFGSFGTSWFLLPYDRKLYFANTGTGTKVHALRSGSERVFFTLNNGQWTTKSALNIKLKQTATGWQIKDESENSLEEYSADGLLRVIRSADGYTQTLTYSTAATPPEVAPRAGLPIQVADNFGRSLALVYDTLSRVKSITDSNAGKYQYAYDPNIGSLASVTYPDMKTRTYLYEIANGPAQPFASGGLGSVLQGVSTINLTQAQYNTWGNQATSMFDAIRRRLADYDAFPLTGIVDENNVRFSKYVYDQNGRGISTEYAGQQKYVFNYGNLSNTTTINDVTVTMPLGATVKTTMSTVQGVARPTYVTRYVNGSPAGMVSKSYDAIGNVTGITDRNNNKTCYAYDATRNLETARIEGLSAGADCASTMNATTLPAPNRKISTQWHPDWKLPVKVAEPKRMTTYVYHGQSEGGSVGNCTSSSVQVDGKPIAVLCKKIVQATLDPTGVQGFNAVADGAPSVWTYTYNGAGQLQTAKGPRTDVDDTSSYSYDPANGNLLSIANAAGHITSLSYYDANGKVGRIVDPNGVQTDLTYYPRGWLKDKVVSAGGVAQTTHYDYDNLGQLTSVSLPDGTSVSYTYDDVHRLTDIRDSLGNRIHYTLDVMGNRTKEETLDPMGNLKRQVSRIYDTLNRLQQVTGGAQ